jgi:hypothetical protein
MCLSVVATSEKVKHVFNLKIRIVSFIQLIFPVAFGLLSAFLLIFKFYFFRFQCANFRVQVKIYRPNRLYRSLTFLKHILPAQQSTGPDATDLSALLLLPPSVHQSVSRRLLKSRQHIHFCLRAAQTHPGAWTSPLCRHSFARCNG